MAYTKIIPIRHSLQNCVNYTTNPEKTCRDGLQTALAYTQNGSKTEQQIYVSGFNCDPGQAAKQMQRTKEKWGKARGRHVLGYHVIQSFAPGEVTPEQAHQLGCELVRRLLGSYEVTVSTHLDRAHLHNHIVFNAVSFVDGKRYRDDFASYYCGIRAASDQLCREHGLSVIDPQRRGKTYAEHHAEKQGQPTMRSLVRADVDKALAGAFTWKMFVVNLQRMGYTVRWGQNVKYAALRHKESKRAIRLKSLGPGYSEQELRARLQEHQTQHTELPMKPIRRRAAARFRGHWPVRAQYTGFLALYYHYVCLFRKARTGHSAARTRYLLREDLTKFDRYVRQAQFLWDNKIQTDADLDAAQNSVQEHMDALVTARAKLQQEKAAAPEAEKAALAEQIGAINGRLRTLRKDVRMCETIRADAVYLKQQVVKARQAEIRARNHRREMQKERTVRE